MRQIPLTRHLAGSQHAVRQSPASTLFSESGDKRDGTNARQVAQGAEPKLLNHQRR